MGFGLNELVRIGVLDGLFDSTGGDLLEVRI